MLRCKGLIPITDHAKYHYSLSSVHSAWFTIHSNHIHTFTMILSGTESRITNRTIPRIAGLESPAIPQPEAKMS